MRTSRIFMFRASFFPAFLEFTMCSFTMLKRTRALALASVCALLTGPAAFAKSADDPPAPPASVGPAALMNVAGGRPHVHVDGHKCSLNHGPVALPHRATQPLPVVLHLGREDQKKERLERARKAGK
jgi:hypothetical protein